MILYPIGYKIDVFIQNYTRNDVKSREFLYFCGKIVSVILKAISPVCSLEGLMMKLKLQYFGHLMWRVDSLEKTLMLGKIEGRRRRVGALWGWGSCHEPWAETPCPPQIPGSHSLGGNLGSKWTEDTPAWKSQREEWANPSQHQGLFQWVNSSHEMAKVLEFQPQH